MNLRRRLSFTTRTALLAAFAVGPLACAADFDTTRVVPTRGTLGRELYSLVCDRVGAQALREDVTGASFHGLCHPYPDGHYDEKVAVEKLVPLDPQALDEDGHVVPIDLQIAHRQYRVARIEALAKRREELVAAFDAAFPDDSIPVKDLANPDATKRCGPAGNGHLQHELGQVLGRMKDLENDRTIPLFTEALARIMNDVKSSPEAQAALARFDARQGYRPSDIALGAVRPALAYPRIVELVDALLQLLATDSDPFDPAGAIDPTKPLGPDNRKPIPGKASAELQQLLAVMHEELRTSDDAPAPPPLVVAKDPTDPLRTLLSRPRTSLELTRQVLLQQDPTFDIGGGVAAKRWVARRDLRGVAAVPLVGGAVPSPFLDADKDLLPDVDPLGRFATAGGPVASPFFSVDGTDGPRDMATGRAVGVMTPLLYDYVDTRATFLARATSDVKPLLDPDPAKEAVMKLLGGAPVVFGRRDLTPVSTRAYTPDPSRVDDWQLAHPDQPAPAGLGTSPVSIPYRAFHADASPIVDLVYALGQLMADPVMDDLLALGQKLVTEHPDELARLIGIGLQVKQIANAHPEAQIPAQSMLWDEMLDVIAKIAAVKDDINAGGILEDLILAFKNDDVAKLQQTFAAYIQYKDALTYDHHSTSSTDKLNGPAFNLTTNDDSNLKTPVDRTKPDVGDNRSALQKFMQLLHDANGLGACTKKGAVAHIKFDVGFGVVPFDYPTDPLSAVACGIVGESAPKELPLCGVLRIENVDALLLDVALNRAQFDVRDPCLKALMNSPLTGIVGGVDAFLQDQSGIQGFDTHPTVPGIARLVYFETPHDGLPGDTNPATQKTYDFLKDIIDPVPTMVCDPAPFVDTDGKTINLRTCKSFNDSIRGRDPGFLFPVEQFDFVKNVKPLAAAFDDHHQPLLFVDLFDVMHRHWGSPAQPKDVCDPSLPHTDARWCSQDGAVSYEPLLAEVLTKTDLFQALHDTVPIIEQTTVTHCDATDPKTHACTKTSTKNGVQVLAEAVRVMTDPARNQGLKDNHGNAFALRNDGTKNPQVTPIYLFIDALKGIDAAFDEWAQTNPNDANRQAAWRDARSQLVDTFLSTKGSGTQTTWANPSIPKILPVLLDALHAQLVAHCPDRSSRAACTWATTDLPKNLADTVGGPLFAAVIDLLDAVRADDRARTELEKLLVYLLDQASDNDAEASTLGAVTDVLQVLSDDNDFSPLYRAIANAAGGEVVTPEGKVVKRALADATIESLSRVFAQAKDAHGNEQCDLEVDPNHAIAGALKHLVTPMGPDQPAPIEVLIDVVADVNRAKPGDAAKLASSDYANIANEVSEFCLDPASGLEQVYEVIKEATAPK